MRQGAADVRDVSGDERDGARAERAAGRSPERPVCDGADTEPPNGVRREEPLGCCIAPGAPDGVTRALLTLWLVRRRITQNLREQLIRRGLSTCRRCGYDLTGNVSGVCPECGVRA